MLLLMARNYSFFLYIIKEFLINLDVFENQTILEILSKTD